MDAGDVASAIAAALDWRSPPGTRNAAVAFLESVSSISSTLCASEEEKRGEPGLLRLTLLLLLFLFTSKCGRCCFCGEDDAIVISVRRIGDPDMCDCVRKITCNERRALCDLWKNVRWGIEGYAIAGYIMRAYMQRLYTNYWKKNLFE